MKKRGFTLAEILVALGIVGVVSAITLPTFVNNANSKSHEMTAKATVNAIENAIGSLLAQDGVNTMGELDAILNDATGEYQDVLITEIKKSLKCSDSTHKPTGANDAAKSLLLKNGSVVSVYVSKIDADASVTAGEIYIDSNGSSTPNKSGVDQFKYNLLGNGILEK